LNFMIIVVFVEMDTGSRAKHIKSSPTPWVNCNDDKRAKKHGVVYPNKDKSRERILNKVRRIIL